MSQKGAAKSSQKPLNILILGDSGVGKTDFCNAYVGNSLNRGYIPSLGLEIKFKNHLIPGSNGKRLPVQLWDFGGDYQKNRNLVNAVVEADAIIFMYDITHIGSFNRLTEIVKKIRTFCGVWGDEKNDIRLPYTALVANKSSLK